MTPERKPAPPQYYNGGEGGGHKVPNNKLIVWDVDSDSPTHSRRNVLPHATGPRPVNFLVLFELVCFIQSWFVHAIVPSFVQIC